MSDREEIAAALTAAVDVVDVAAKYRQSLAPFQGFVRWNGRLRGSEGLGWVDEWQVWLALPQDVKKAESWLDAHLPELLAALDDEAIATSATPAELVLGSNAVNGVILSGSRPASD